MFFKVIVMCQDPDTPLPPSPYPYIHTHKHTFFRYTTNQLLRYTKIIHNGECTKLPAFLIYIPL